MITTPKSATIHGNLVFNFYARGASKPKQTSHQISLMHFYETFSGLAYLYYKYKTLHTFKPKFV